MKAINIYLSENAVVDAQEGKLSLINIVDNISSISYPLFLPTLAITCVTEKDSVTDDFECIIKCNLNESEIQKFPFKFSFRGSNRARTILKINGFIFPSPGIYKFNLCLNDKTLISSIIDARLKENIITKDV